MFSKGEISRISGRISKIRYNSAVHGNNLPVINSDIINKIILYGLRV